MFLRIIVTVLFMFTLGWSASEPIPIHKGWQMVGSSNSVASLQDFNRSEISIVWLYDSENGKWKAFSPDANMSTLITSSGYEALNTVPPKSAIWVYATSSGILKLDTNDSNLPLALKSGWQSVSSSYGFGNMQDFNRSDIESVWLYEGMNGTWSAFSPDTSIQNAIDSHVEIQNLEKIPANRGFWVKAKSDITLPDAIVISDIDENSSTVAPTSGAYDYNSDKTAFLKIKQEVCNDWKSAFTSSEFINADPQTKTKYYNKYLNQSLESNADKYPIYAPRGSAGDFNVTISDGVYDFSGYKVPGDLNGDGNVSQEDADQLIAVLSLPTYMTPPDMYDLNKDGVVDHRDLLYLGARLMTQVKTFDFYSADGEKLDIPTMSWNAFHSLSDLNSSIPSTIRVIARDENGASSSKNEKITAGEWYKDFPTVSARKLQRANENASECALDLSGVNELFSAPQSKYVIGFRGFVKYIEGKIIDKQGEITADLSGCHKTLADIYLLTTTHRYFVPTDMGYHNVKFGGNEKTLGVVDGFRFSDRVITDIELLNQHSADMGTEITEHSKTIKHSFEHNGKMIVAYMRIEVENAYLESYKKYPAQGTLTRNASDEYEDCGNMRFDRYGPAWQKDSESTALERVSHSKTKYDFANVLSMGHYHSSVVWPKGSDYLLKNNFIVKKGDNEKNFVIPWQPRSVKGHIYDKYQQPLSGKKMILQSTCDATLKKYYTSKEDGSFEFKDADIGEYEIYVDGSSKAVVAQKGNGAEVDIRAKPLWRLKIHFSNTLGSGTMTIKRFHLDCEDANAPSDQLNGRECTFIGNDYFDKTGEKTTIYYSTIYEDAELPPLAIYTNGIVFNAEQYAGEGDGSEGILEKIGSLAGFDNMGYDPTWHCDGRFPSGSLAKIKAGEKVSYHSPSSRCTFTLEPCKNQACEESTPPADDFDEFDDFDVPSDNTGTTGPGAGLGD